MSKIISEKNSENTRESLRVCIDVQWQALSTIK
jgi:hypothetical protein